MDGASCHPCLQLKHLSQGCAYTPYLHFQTVYTVQLRFIYGTVTVRYGPKPYNTVKMKIQYGSGTVRKPVDRTSLHGHPF